MNQQNELKNMIMRFRVVELHSLLGFLSIRVNGLRKRELQKKALKEIDKRCTSLLSKKIRSIYKKMLGGCDDEFLPSDLEDCAPSFHDHLENYFNNYFCSNDDINQRSASQNLEISRVKFNDLTFYEYKYDVLTLTPILPRKYDSNLCLFDIPFRLNRETLTLICSEESRYKTLLRLCILNDEIQVKDQLPPTLTVRVNYQYCSLPSTSSSKQAEAKMCAPIDITSYIEKTKLLNVLSLQWIAEYGTRYAVTIQFMRQYTSEDLINKLKAKGERDSCISKKFINDSLNDDEDEIATTSLKMSLTCPLGKIPISLPTRATTCNHLQCFDGTLYIKMNEVKSTWQCPVCYKKCLFEDLFIDGYFMEILKSDKFKTNPTDIQINQDGSWEPVEQTHRSNSRTKKNMTDCDVEEISIRNSVNKNQDSQVQNLSRFHIQSSESSSTDDICENLISRSLCDEMRDFIENFNFSEGLIDTQRPSCSKLPSNNDISNELFGKRPSNSSNSPLDDRPPPKKKIILVDLTNSGSESDVESTSSSISSSDTTVSPLSSRPPTPTFHSSLNGPILPSYVPSTENWTPLPTKYAHMLSPCSSNNAIWNISREAPTSSAGLISDYNSASSRYVTPLSLSSSNDVASSSSYHPSDIFYSPPVSSHSGIKSLSPPVYDILSDSD